MTQYTIVTYFDYASINASYSLENNNKERAEQQISKLLSEGWQLAGFSSCVREDTIFIHQALTKVTS